MEQVELIEKTKRKGMTESELQALARGSSLEDLRRFPFWSAEVYGFGKAIRKYGYYPAFLPLCIQTDHGPTQVDAPVKGHLHPKAPAQFFHAQRLVDVAKKQTRVPCYSLYSPFVFYRRKHHIKQTSDASGTLAFPAHSTHHINIRGGYKDYAELLVNLPEVYQPVSVCVYFLDIQKGLHQPFVEKGIPVYTVGDWLKPQFTERFYALLSHFKYATSNLIGSYLFYATEMDIPFFLYGERPAAEKTTDADVFVPDIKKKPLDGQYYKVLSLFTPMSIAVTQEQKIMVETELGITSGVSRRKMAVILYSSLAIFYAKGYYSKFFRFGIRVKNKIFKYKIK